MKKRGENQFHPSRDKAGEGEYELPGLGGIHVIGPGYYDDEAELDNATESARDSGETLHPLLQPLQGRLFDAEKHEAANRMELGRQRFAPTDPVAEGIRDSALRNTRIPTSDLQSRGDRQETELTSENEGRPWRGSGVAGWYRGPSGRAKADKLAMNPETGHGTDSTFTHEAGHRQHLGEVPAMDDSITHPHQQQPDPLKEGVADAYADRYAGPDAPQVRFMKEDIEEGTPFASYSFTGYSADREAANRFGWTRDDRALYVATRAHASETGEQPTYEPRGRHVMEQPGVAVAGGGMHPTIDATIHGLMNAGPHAREALKNADMNSIYAGDLAQAGEDASRRHMDRTLLTEGQNIQEGLFHELRGDASGEVRGYTPNIDAMPEAANQEEFDAKFTGMSNDIERVEAAHPGEMAVPHHMSYNQFGEAPRTQRDVNMSLGVSAVNAKKRGFPDR